MRVFLMISALMCGQLLIGEETAAKQGAELSLGPRISNLLPDIIIPLMVDPAIPENFVALRPEGTSGYDWIYWGPRNALTSYFRDRESLKEPIISLRPSLNVAQTGPDKFSIEDENIKELVKSVAKDAKLYRYKWGQYPVLSFEGEMFEKPFCTCWVGTNNPDGWVLQFNLICPKGEDGARQGRLLWTKLMTETKPLSEPDGYRAAGFDLQEGFTMVDVTRSKLKAIAEKRKADKKIQVVVTSLDPLVTFSFDKVESGKMGGSWKRGALLAKAYGLISKDEKDNTKIRTQIAIPILIKEVEEFSMNGEELKAPGIYVQTI